MILYHPGYDQLGIVVPFGSLKNLSFLVRISESPYYMALTDEWIEVGGLL